MATILITGSTTGLGKRTAELLLADGHQVVLHARNHGRAEQIKAELPQAAAVLSGDLSLISESKDLARQANDFGHFDAVIHNAGVYNTGKEARLTADGLSENFAVNVLAPYILSILINRPGRLIFLSSNMHGAGQHDLSDPHWQQRPLNGVSWNSALAYSESKFYLTLLTMAFSRCCPEIICNAVDPGWVPTRMGGASAPDDLTLGCETQAWLATSDDPLALRSGGYFHHRRLQQPHADVHNQALQQKLFNYCAELADIL
ncbi:MAG: short-chain dehydrogenase [Oleibacter sp.]|nr:short-chain dehydrogenase [Thalassolituus sp.]